MAERREVRLAGAGTHGMIEAGLILQEAAAIYDDLNAHHVQSYGPEARSQVARSEVIISAGDIDYPKATQVDVLLVTTAEALERYSKDLRPNALVLIDEEVRPKAPSVGRCSCCRCSRPRSRSWASPTCFTWWPWAPWSSAPKSSPSRPSRPQSKITFPGAAKSSTYRRCRPVMLWGKQRRRKSAERKHLSESKEKDE